MDNEETFLSFLSEEHLESLLTPQEALKIRSKLWDILAGRAESYTMGSSSSVRIETARELLRSAGFVLSHGLRHGLGHGTDAADDAASVKTILLNGNFDALFRTGIEMIGALVREGEVLLQRVQETATAVENSAYRGTFKELGVFFKRYHYHHFAHEIPCMLDYPLAHPVDEALLGIDYINEYLRRLLVENGFCSRFDPETVTRLLRSASPDYKDELLNVYETVAGNALALTLLGGDIRGLDVTEQDRNRLLSLIVAWTEESAQQKLRAATSGLCAILDIRDDPAREYLALTASSLYIRLKPLLPLGRLEHMFPPLYREKEKTRTAVKYIDGTLMDDEKLRALIDALTSCVDVSDKIALARQHIGSLRDWAEILNICFWGAELRTAFESFSPDEIDLLLRYVREKRKKYPEWISETGWEEALTQFADKSGGIS